ncbi:CBS domain-containing protein [Prauserella flavalba]|uniref:CBS domain-containing protein n=1 Tax=Prauserella flavalba TaxID=1477506 RepID=A0A318LW64_9PSEU|nr:CBS domain-containing protein [Prauserella flavalba]PXY36538.1 hypothetical protein BA062_14235 [Prauserella flavalba]
MRIHEIMSRPVVAVTTEATPAETAEVLHREGFTTLPVLDRRGRLAGLVGEPEVVGYFLGEARRAAAPYGPDVRQEATAGGLMRTPAASVHTEATVADAVTTMLEGAQRCLPVVGDDGQVVGIVSWRDVLRRVILPAGSARS